jgi:hypothetical protein
VGDERSRSNLQYEMQLMMRLRGAVHWCDGALPRVKQQITTLPSHVAQLLFLRPRLV